VRKLTNPKDPSKTIDVPPELEGLDDETALEILNTIGADESEGEAGTDESTTPTEEVAGGGEAEETEDAAGEDSPDETATQTETDAEVAEEGEGGETTVPIAALHEARAKLKENKTKAQAAEEENLRLRTELQQARQQQAVVPVTPSADTTPVKPPALVYWNGVCEMAVQKFQQDEGRLPDDGNIRDSAVVSGYVRDIDTEVREKAVVRYEYGTFKRAEKVKEYSDELGNFALNRLKKSMNFDEAAPISEAYNRCEQGFATPSDLRVVRDFWTETEKKFLETKNPPAKQSAPAVTLAQPPAKKPTPESVESKAKAMESHPRAGQIKGGEGGGGYSMEQLEHMLNTMDWDQIPEQAQKMLKGLT
jgi:hypothetical protein